MAGWRRRKEDRRAHIEWLEDAKRGRHELLVQLTDPEWQIVQAAADLLYRHGKTPPYGKAASLFLVRGIIDAQREAVALSQRGGSLLPVQEQMLTLHDPIHGGNGYQNGHHCPTCGAQAKKAGRSIRNPSPSRNVPQNAKSVRRNGAEDAEALVAALEADYGMESGATDPKPRPGARTVSDVLGESSTGLGTETPDTIEQQRQAPDPMPRTAPPSRVAWRFDVASNDPPSGDDWMAY